MARKNKLEKYFKDKTLLNGGFYKEVLIDSDTFVALIKKNDTNHEKAKELSQFLRQKGSIFITTNYVFSETITVLSQRISHKTAVDFINDLKNEESEISLLRANDKIEELAIKIFKRQTSKNVSFVDCINMAFLKRYKWDAIFSFDKVYKKNGFKLADSG